MPTFDRTTEPKSKTLLFDFNDMTSSDKAAVKAMKYFARAGSPVIAVNASSAIKRTSGVSYREMTLSFGDSQTITLRVKPDGDVFEVLLNKKLVPIKNQDDHIAAVAELVGMMNAGRTKFQQKLAKALIKLPPSIKTAAPKMLQVLTEKRDALIAAIDDVKVEIETIRATFF